MRLILAATLICGLPMAAVAADDPHEAALEMRHGFFQMLSHNMGQLSGMAKGDVAYDEAAAVRAAANIEALSRYDITGHFIDGTATGQLDDSAMKPEAVTDRAGLTARFADLQTAATGISESVKGGQDKVAPVVQALGATCKACHDSYRAQ